MGLLMYRASSPSPPIILKQDSTAAARSPIRRASSRSHPSRPNRRVSSPAIHPRSPPSSSEAVVQDSVFEPYSVPGNYTPLVVSLPSERDVQQDAPRAEDETLPFVQNPARLSRLGHRASPTSASRPQLPHNPDSTRRMQITRQRATRRADLEAELSTGRFVVRPILSDDDDRLALLPSGRARQPDTQTVDPINLMFNAPSERDAGRRSRRLQAASNSAPFTRARSRSPQRLSVASRFNAPDATDGLGDRRRSPSMEDSDWETLRATIQPDEQLPSASSSFTSASASATSSASSRDATSAHSSATTTASSTWAAHRYIAPPRSHREVDLSSHVDRDMVCDDARDTQPPFGISRGPSRHTTREPSTHSPPIDVATQEQGPVDDADLHVLLSDTRNSTTAAPAWNTVLGSLASAAPPTPGAVQGRPSSTAPSHLRSPSPGEEGGSQHARLGARLAEVQLQWHQLRRINELLRCGREVPGWLWEVAGLAPELPEFEI